MLTKLTRDCEMTQNADLIIYSEKHGKEHKMFLVVACYRPSSVQKFTRQQNYNQKTVQ